MKAHLLYPFSDTFLISEDISEPISSHVPPLRPIFIWNLSGWRMGVGCLQKWRIYCRWGVLAGYGHENRISQSKGRWVQPFRGKMHLELALAWIREVFVFANWQGGREAHVLLKVLLASCFVCMVVFVLQHLSVAQGWTLQWNWLSRCCQWLIRTAQLEQLEQPRRRGERTRGLPAKTLRQPLDELQLWENELGLRSVVRLFESNFFSKHAADIRVEGRRFLN